VHRPESASGLVSSLQRPEWYWPIALVSVGFYVVSSLYIAAHRLLWFDEILTALVSRLPDLPTTWKALSEIAEQTPPLYFLITRIFDQMFGHADLALRIPSVFGFGFGLLFIFDTARRLTDGLYGLIATAFIATPFVTYYGHEARSYALYFMFVAFALWLWIATGAESKIAAVAFGGVFLTGVAVHYYFVLCLIPFGLEALMEKRAAQPKIIAATTGVILALAALYPQIASARAFAKTVSNAWAPSVNALLAAFMQFFTNAIIPLMTIALQKIVFRGSRKQPVPDMSSGERLGWLFVTAPLAAYFLGHLVTHSFHDRYIIGAGPGLALGLACVLWRHFHKSQVVSLALLLAFGVSAITQQVFILTNIAHLASESGDYQHRITKVIALEDTLIREGKQHLLVPSDVEYLETWYYSKRRSQYQCITAEQRWGLKNYVPLTFVSIPEIVSNAGRTAVIGLRDAPREAIEKAGLHFKIRFTEPQQIAYLE